MTNKKKKSEMGGFQKGFLLKKEAGEKPQRSRQTANTNKPYCSSFPRGFLLPSSRTDNNTTPKVSKKVHAKPKKRTTAVSSDLLSLEEEPNARATNLWVLSTTDNEEEGTSSSGRNASLLQEISTDSYGKGESSSSHKQANPLIQEISTSSEQQLHTNDEGIDVPNEAHNNNSSTRSLFLDISEASEQSCSSPFIQEVSSCRKKSSLPVEDPATPSQPTPLGTTSESSSKPILIPQKAATTTQQTQKRVVSILNRIKRSKNWKHVAKDFCQDVVVSWSASEIVVVWRYLLERMARTGQTLAEERLGLLLLREKEIRNHFWGMLESTDTQHDRVLALGCILLLDKWQCAAEGEVAELVTLVQEAIPRLCKLVFKHPTRTVMTQKSAVVVLEIVACVAEANSGQNELAKLLWGCALDIQQVWRVQQNWLDREDCRKKCVHVVLCDWLRITTECQYVHDDIICRGQSSDEASRGAAEKWLWNLRGVRASQGEEFRIGGIRQTLLSSPRLTTSQVVMCLETAEQMFTEERRDVDDEFLTSFLRGVVAWFGQSKKHLASLTRESNSQQMSRVIELSLSLLRCKAATATDFILAILNCVWSGSHGIPPDVTNTETGIPPSYEGLLEAIRSASELTASTMALCGLATRCIKCRGQSLVTALIASNGICDSTLSILASLLEPEANSMGVDTVAIGRILLESIPSSNYLRRRLKGDGDITFLCLPLDFVVPGLVGQLSAIYNTSKMPVQDDAVATVVTCLTRFMEHHVHQGLDDFTRLTIDAMANISESPETQSTIDKIASKFGGSWRRSLLLGSTCGDNGFKELMSSMGKAMLASPDSMVPLTLFGAVVGDGNTEHLAEREYRRIHLATTEVVRLSVAGLQKESQQGDDMLFQRLSPLLLLRRTPAAYFRISWRERTKDTKGDTEYISLMTSLAQLMAQRLDVCELRSKEQYTSEERRLAAEIAGRCLPYGSESRETEGCSCFHQICKPSLSSVIAVLKEKDLSSNSLGVIRSARAGLYATCHHLPLAANNDEGGSLLAVASLALDILWTDKMSESDEVVRLESGCVELFALVLEKTSQLRAEKCRNSELISELDLISDNRESAAMERVTVIVALGRICRILVTVLRTAVSDATSSDCLYVDTRSFSVPARICIWNSYIVAAQRCEEGTPVDLLARLSLPWIFEWASAGSLDSDLRHPLCVAAALRVCFILITRTKSFGGVQTLKAHRWALGLVKSNFTDQNTATVRVAALKLVLAIVTVEQLGDNMLSTNLGPADLVETLSVVQGAANLDVDPDVQQFASHVVGVLGRSVQG